MTPAAYRLAHRLMTARSQLKNGELTMRLDPLLKSEKVTLVIEAIGDDKVRVSCASREDAPAILANEALEVVRWGRWPT
jgi:hypothetical protein